MTAGVAEAVRSLRRPASPATPDRTPNRIALICAALSAGVGFLVALATQGGRLDPRALVNLASTDPLAGLVRAGDPSFPLVTPAQHYDGVYYYAIARDPLALGRAHTMIDQAAYRYGHPLHGWLAALLSAGQPRAVPAALFALSLIGLGAAALFASRLAHELGGGPWLGLLVPCSPGLLYSVTVSTTEAVGAALVLAALLCWQQQRIGPAGVLMALACLDKEQYVAVPVGLAAWELIRFGRTRVPPLRPRARAAALVLAPVPLGCWYLYVHGRFERWPFQYQSGNLGAPVRGWLTTFGDARALSTGDFDQSEIGSVVAPVLIALAVVLVAAALRAAWLHANPLHLPLVLLVAITACQDWRTLLYPHELVRTPAVALLLGLLVLLIPADRRAAQPDSQEPGRAPRFR